MSTLSQIITESIQRALNHPKEFVSLHEPRFSGNESKYVLECIDSTFVSSVGKFVDRLENDLREYTGAKYVVAVTNGTAALHMALLLAGVESGDEILVPALTFVATANAVRYCGAFPHFVDSEESTLGLNPDALREYLQLSTEQHSGNCVNRITGKRIRAMVPVHVFGHPCRIDELWKVAKDFNLVMIEDAAESLGSTYYDQHTGTFGLLGTLSFNGNKTITTGGGGAVLTNDFELSKKARHLTTTAKIAHSWDYIHDEVGYNYRMPNINAALGCAQLEQLPEFLVSKRILFERYQEFFRDIENVSLFTEPEGSRSNYWLQTLLLNDSVENQSDSILDATNSAGLMTRPAWRLLHNLTPFKDCPHAPLPIAESLERRIVNLPSSAGLV
jgi:aminotransferase in exopolysaccharide biosynthesis